MVCDCCDERIECEVTVVDFGRMGRLYFCDDDCKDMYIDNCTTEQVLDEELDALEDRDYE